MHLLFNWWKNCLIGPEACPREEEEKPPPPKATTTSGWNQSFALPMILRHNLESARCLPTWLEKAMLRKRGAPKNLCILGYPLMAERQCLRNASLEDVF